MKTRSATLICLIFHSVIHLIPCRSMLEWDKNSNYPSAIANVNDILNFVIGSDGDKIWIMISTDGMNTSPDKVYRYDPARDYFRSYSSFYKVGSGNCGFFTFSKQKIYAPSSGGNYGNLFVFDMQNQSETLHVGSFASHSFGNDDYCLAIDPSDRYLSIIKLPSTFMIYDLFTETYHSGPSLPSEHQFYDASCIVSSYNNYLYVFTGNVISKIYISPNDITQTINGTWTELDDTLSSEVYCRFNPVELNNKIYIIGGMTYNYEYSANVDVLDLVNHTITADTPLNTGRARGAAAVSTHTNSIYVFGGVESGYPTRDNIYSYEVGTFVTMKDTDAPITGDGDESNSISPLVRNVLIGVGIIVLFVLLVIIAIFVGRSNLGRSKPSPYSVGNVQVETMTIGGNSDNCARSIVEKYDQVETVTIGGNNDQKDATPPPKYVAEMDENKKLSNSKEREMTLWMNDIVGLPQYVQLFVENGLDDIEIIKKITKNELKEVGVKLGHQIKIMEEIKKLNGDNNEEMQYLQEGGVGTVHFE